jgi:hypothetical protein
VAPMTFVTRLRWCAIVGLSLATLLLQSSSALAGPPPGGTRLGGDNNGRTTYLSRCSLLRKESSIWSCYVTRLLADIERSKDPANELPRIDRKVRAGHGYLEVNCHMMMHVVGRTYARKHNVTLANLQRYLPRSNDPGCSAGFGMGMVMTLGRQIGQLGPAGAVQLCLHAPTRFRSYTCIHTLGHAYMRLYHGQLKFGLEACRALPPRQAPDCAQGAYHDYWLGIAGRDSAKRPRNGLTSARALCGRQISSFVRPCWYRYFLELPPRNPPTNAAGVRALCPGLAGVQRRGCIAAASLVSSSDPFRQMQICAHLRGADSVSCLYGVNVQNLATSRGSRRVRLIERCGRMSRKAQDSCYEWLGTALAVVTNGGFRDRACPFISSRGRDACLAGARRMSDALVTFS